MRPGGKDGKLYRILYGEAQNGGAVEKTTFAKIVARADPSGLPEPSAGQAARGAQPLGSGNVFRAKAGLALEAGDKILPMALKLISFVTDVQDSGQKQSHDVTTQADVDSGNRSYLPGAFQERTGTISGVVDVDSEEQTELWNEYRQIIEEDGDDVGVFPARAVEHEYMMSRRETAEEGEIEVWEYMPLISESLQAGKPMDGVQPFSFNYRVDGKRKPAMLRLKAEEEA
jgi:hypothetical protein